MSTDFKDYPRTRVKIKSTGQEGEAFESLFGFISVFVDGSDKCKLFDINDVEIIDPKQAKFE